MKTERHLPETPQRSGFLYHLVKYRILLVMLLPAVIYFIIFSYIPMAGGVVAFKTFDYSKGIFGSPWAGFKNFKYLFASGKAWMLTKNTFVYNISFICSALVLQVSCAVFLSEIRNKYTKKFFQSFLLLPYFISWVVVGLISYNLLNYEYGIVNRFLVFFGLEPVNFYTNPQYWKGILVFFNAWKGLGYGSVIYVAAISGMSQEMYEAAEIDGANIWQRVFHITLPNLKPTIITVFLLDVSRIFRGNFQMFYNLVGENGVLFKQTDVIDTYVFRALINSNELGMSSAAGLYQSVLCFVFIMLVNTIVKKIDPDSALF